MRVLRLMTLVCLIVAPGWPAAQAADRLALVIGNSAYVHAEPLANPKNDAQDVAERLSELGFKVVLGLDLDKVGFDAKVRDFAHELDGADSAILFYAGHGLQVAGHNYLVPVDAKLERERDLEFEAVRLDFILKQMEIGREDKTNIVFLDACRDNPLARNLARSMGTRSTAIGKGLAQVEAGVGTFISYSTQPGNVALDGTGRNSPFTAALVERMTEKGRNLTSLMIDVRKDVIAATGGRQVPWDHSALTGDFFFDPEGAAQSSESLQNRVRQLEDEVKARTQSANVATTATLTQLRQRVKQLDAETRRDWERVFKIQRDKTAAGTAAQADMNRELHQLQVGIVERGRDINELKAEIARLEKELGPAAAAQ